MRDDVREAHETYGILTEDYRPTPGRVERALTTWLLKTLFGKASMALDFGEGDIRPFCKGEARVHMAPPRFLTLLGVMTNAGLRFGEAFMDGAWHMTRGSVADLLIEILTTDGADIKKHGLTLGVFQAITHVYKQFLATFSATREVARHYDVNTDLYKRMIGPTMTYSCAFWEDGITTLDAAQARKFETICRRLELDGLDEVRILDIGCGWGSFEMAFPKDKHGRIDGISISDGQIAHARTQIEALSDKGRVEVDFIKEDYRHYCQRKPGAYNRVVSIGMLEHVGLSKYGHYFSAIREVLSDDGLAVVHSIAKHARGATNLWIDRYIFPGGYAPMISEVVSGIEKSGLKIKAIHYHAGENYIRTLKVWLKNLLANEDEILALLVDEQDKGTPEHKARVARTTFRMFIFYLSSVQMMFHPDYGDDGVVHFVVTK
jgi:cyclopropane-fatty-acyl-phospholipid synthase